jgi:peptidoglycan/LPS O-acetylase OafA/YrhL
MTYLASRTDVTTRWMRRVARIWSIVIIGIALLVAVTHLIVPDTEATDFPPIENLLPVVLFSSVLGLALAWRWEGIGGALNGGLFLVHLGLY